jgi:hypothetical protein
LTAGSAKSPTTCEIEPGGVLDFAALYEMWRFRTNTKTTPDRWLWTAVIIRTDAMSTPPEF